MLVFVLHAYIDESGVTGEASRSSKHFVLGAVILDGDNENRAHDFLAELREGISRQPGHVIHWNQITNHGARRYLTQTLGEQDWLRLSTVVVCRNHVPDSLPTPQVRYQFTLRMLLERLSWFADSKRETLHYTISHWRGFQNDDLRAYEQRLREDPGNIKMHRLDSAGGTVARNTDVELLQLADVVASSTACAFEPDDWGYTERDYLMRTLPRFYRHNSRTLRSYGLKMHPTRAHELPGYEWLSELT